MSTPTNIDDELLARAWRIVGLNEKTTLLREGLRALIECESARSLAELGGSEPRLKTISRRASSE